MTKETTTEKASRKQFMKWLTLGKDKDPEFEKVLFLSDGKEFYCGGLVKIEQIQVGKKYSFNIGLDGGGGEVISTSITHYCNPVSPV